MDVLSIDMIDIDGVQVASSSNDIVATNASGVGSFVVSGVGSFVASDVGSLVGLTTKWWSGYVVVVFCEV